MTRVRRRRLTRVDQGKGTVSGRRVLYVSCSLGLGHVKRDLAIAGQLRRLDPDVEILWLAAEPASGVLAQAGETLSCLSPRTSATRPKWLKPSGVAAG